MCNLIKLYWSSHDYLANKLPDRADTTPLPHYIWHLITSRIIKNLLRSVCSFDESCLRGGTYIFVLPCRSSLKGGKLFNLSDMIRYVDSSWGKSNRVHRKVCYWHIFSTRKFFPARETSDYLFYFAFTVDIVRYKWRSHRGYIYLFFLFSSCGNNESRVRIVPGTWVNRTLRTGRNSQSTANAFCGIVHAKLGSVLFFLSLKSRT